MQSCKSKINLSYSKFLLFINRYTKNGYTQSMDKIHMNINELLTFFQIIQNVNFKIINKIFIYLFI